MKLFRLTHSLLFGITLLAIGACGASPAPNKSEPAKPSTIAEGMTGGLSEEAFKALHELKTDASPQLDGQDITLDGTKDYLSLPNSKKPPQWESSSFMNSRPRRT